MVFKRVFDHEAVCRSYQVLGSIAEVARKFGMNAQTVSNILQAAGLRAAAPFSPPFKLNEDVLRRLYVDDGLSASDIAQQFGCNGQTVLNALVRFGIPRRPGGSRSGSKNHRWTGGRIFDKHGYVLIHIPDHPNANSGGYVREHRLVMERQLGRLLQPHEVIHHKDGDRANNAPHNLELFQENAEHLRHELTGRVPKWTEDGLRRIRERRIPVGLRASEETRAKMSASQREARTRRQARLEAEQEPE